MLDLDSALSVAVEAAKAAGEVLKNNFKQPLTIRTKRTPRDLVTQVDHEAQAVVVKILSEAFPDHRFLTEELGAEELGNIASPYLWIVDPLDGTTNYVHGKTLCGTCIALQENDMTVLGVMFNTFTNMLFTGIRGQGACWNGKRITHLRSTRDLYDAILCTNMASRAGSTDTVKRLEVPVCASVQNYGCAMEEIAAVLRGENDGVFFDGVGLWDVAAGCLLIEEAGGLSRTEFKDPADPRKGVRCVASTKPIFDDLCDFVWKQ